MKWADFVGNRVVTKITPTNYADTDIECPICGAFIKRRMDIVLTSNPPKYEYKCLKCNWRGTA